MNNLFVKSNNVVQKTILNWRLSTKNMSRRDSGLTTSKDYRNIIERLQVSSKRHWGSFIYVCGLNNDLFIHSFVIYPDI